MKGLRWKERGDEFRSWGGMKVGEKWRRWDRREQKRRRGIMTCTPDKG